MRRGVDYRETFAGVANAVTIRVVIALAVSYDLELEQMDVCAAYLTAPTEEDLQIYVAPPTGFQIPRNRLPHEVLNTGRKGLRK